MKKLLFLLLSVGLLSFTTVTKPAKALPAKHSTTVACNYGQCQATAKSTGNQCKHCVSKSGDSYCFQHK